MSTALPFPNRIEHAVAVALLVGWPIHDALVMWPPLLRAKNQKELTQARWRAYALAIGMPTLNVLAVMYGAKKGLLPSSKDMLLEGSIIPASNAWNRKGKLALGIVSFMTLEFCVPTITTAITGNPPRAADTEKGGNDVNKAGQNAFSLWHPVSAAEMVGWGGVALLAGVSEEILFRGFLPVYVAKLLGRSEGHSWVTHGISNILFGLGHLYARENEEAGLFNNWKGAAVSAYIGTFFSFLALETRCNKYQILCHFLIDISVGGLVYLIRRKTKTVPEVAKKN